MRVIFRRAQFTRVLGVLRGWTLVLPVLPPAGPHLIGLLDWYQNSSPLSEINFKGSYFSSRACNLTLELLISPQPWDTLGVLVQQINCRLVLNKQVVMDALSSRLFRRYINFWGAFHFLSSTE
ncbi:hypothetical protein RRG08_030250 [Elysia crispata]|uniref:Uncharacterized protein n=1 Tax=Elysia crispata TaxID=231223 RepID=A0AAE1DZA9_9GAST|nr:hypothetical protein RRG08_030250 [Elysia crispata]